MTETCAPCDEPPAFFFSRGPGTYAVTNPLPVAARKKLVDALAAKSIATGVILLRGGISSTRFDTDHEHLFRQESYFAHLLGVREPDCWALIELPSGRTTLLIPRLAPAYAVWMGAILPPEHFRKQYHVDACGFTDEVSATLSAALAASPGPVRVLDGSNSDSDLNLATILPTAEAIPAGATVDAESLYDVAAECRVCKSADEIDLMRYVSWVSSCAHASVMADVKSGMMEYQLEALFLFHCAYYGGCRLSAYTCICACGPNSSVLHYGHAGAPNDRCLKDTDMALLDMGCEYNCYTSDITCSFPVGGNFTRDQRMVYEAVLESQKQILGAMRPGVSWLDMHLLMNRVTLTHLKAAGLLQGDVEEMMAANLGSVFTPCGLGHLIGIDTHDVGGYLAHTPSRSPLAGLSKLRTARVLKAGMVLTVEPGCYFIDALLDPALSDPEHSRFLVPDAIDRFRGTGGVRLEDVVVVTETGVDNLTLCPRTVSEVESVCRGGQWPPAADSAPWLFRRWMKLDKATGKMVPDKSVRVEPAVFTIEEDF